MLPDRQALCDRMAVGSSSSARRLLGPGLQVEASCRRVGDGQIGCPGTTEDLRMLSWNTMSRHLALSGRKEAELAWNHVMNLGSCSWLPKTALHRRIHNCHFFLIETSEDVNTGPSKILRASFLTDTAGTQNSAFFQ